MSDTARPRSSDSRATGHDDTSWRGDHLDWSKIVRSVGSSSMVWVSLIGLVMSFWVATRSSSIESSSRAIGAGAIAIAILMISRGLRDDRSRPRLATWFIVAAVGLASVVAPGRFGGDLLRVAGVVALIAAVVDLNGWRQQRTATWLLVRAGLFVAIGVLVIAFPLEMFRGLTFIALIVFIVLLVASLYDAIYPDALDDSSDVTSVVARWARRTSEGVDPNATAEKVIFASENLLQRASAFLTLMLLAATLASLGVVADSTATVIGAMLVAPLMTPLMGIALSLVNGWGQRAFRMGAFALIGIALAITIGYFIGSIVSPVAIDVTTNSQILGRVSPTSVDLMIAVIAGISGAYGLSRADISDSLPGVAIAISLVPPLGVVGICLSQSAWPQAIGALTLFTTNALAIIVCGAITFVLMGIAQPRPLAAGSSLALGGFVIAILIVAGLLMLNGSRITDGITNQNSVEQAVSTWAGSHDVRVVSVTRSSGDVAVVVAGDQLSKQAQQQLADVVADALDRDVNVDLRITPEQRAELSGTVNN